ncbi:MAG: peptidylprolyl isomerase [Acidobacteriota bacterium]
MNLRAAVTVTVAVLAAAGGIARAQTPSPQAPAPAPAAPNANRPVELDHVVAMIGTNVILQSDVEQEMDLSALEPLRVLPGQNTPDSSLRRLIDRTLILEQMKQQLQATTTPAEEVSQSIAELKKQIPACIQFHCETAAGWKRFLDSNHLDEPLVEERWSQRIAILHFIDSRFRSGIRISQDQIADYYQKTLVPALEKDNQKAPPLADVSSRIREILLQQQVSGLFQDWLGSLRDQGNVQIVDQAYSADLESRPRAAEQ